MASYLGKAQLFPLSLHPKFLNTFWQGATLPLVFASQIPLHVLLHLCTCSKNHRSHWITSSTTSARAELLRIDYTQNNGQREGFDFLLNVFNNPTHLEDTLGLTQLNQPTKDIAIEWDEKIEDNF